MPADSAFIAARQGKPGDLRRVVADSYEGKRRLRSRPIISVSCVVIAMSFLLAGRAYRNLTTVRQNGLRLIWWLLLQRFVDFCFARDRTCLSRRRRFHAGAVERFGHEAPPQNGAAARRAARRPVADECS